MRYYWNEKLRSSIIAKPWVVITSIGYEEVTYEEYLELTGAASRGEAEESAVVIEDDEPEVDEPEAEVADSSSSVLDGLFASVQSPAEESTSAKLQADESVLAQEEAVAANSFETIRELRDHADTEQEGRVTKGKAHGVYSFQEGEWVRTGDLT